jgi:hypothetical protein
MPEPRWRVGRKLGRTLYLDGQCVGMVDTPTLATSIVVAMNAESPSVVALEEKPKKMEVQCPFCRQKLGLPPGQGGKPCHPCWSDNRR